MDRRHQSVGRFLCDLRDRPPAEIVDVDRRAINHTELRETHQPIRSGNRRWHEWDAGRVPGAIHIGKGVIERDIEERIPDHDAPIVLQCGGGFRSVLVCENLARMGYTNTWSLAGGYRDWVEKGLPVETDAG